MKIKYVSGEPGMADGAQIFDSKLVEALIKKDIQVSLVHPQRQRALRLPFWKGQIVALAPLRDQLQRARRQGHRIVLSHEGFFEIVNDMFVDVLIVHNYMLCFKFPGKKWLEAYYRLGSRAFFANAFANAGTVVFVSYRDYRHAISDFPLIKARSLVLPPPPHQVETGARRNDVIHISGSEAWLPKRLSRLTDLERQQIDAAGFKIEDFGPRPSRAFGLISDRFSVGFKLKLMQMLHVGDAVASLSEIKDEVMELAPGYPWWKEVSSVAEAVNWFSDLRRDPAWRMHGANELRAALPSWHKTADELIKVLENTHGQCPALTASRCHKPR